MNPKELPWDRLATTDPRGNRVYLYPREAAGRWQRRRSVLSGALVVVFLARPWLRIGGHQALLLDIPHRRFAILGLTFWAHDVPLLFFVLGGAVLFLAFITAIWGRVWCGWGCPQTIFVEQVFRRVERWIEGDSVARQKLDQSPLGAERVLKKTAKYGAFLILSLVISHSFLAYFVGTEELSLMVRGSPAEHPASFLIMAGIAALVLFDFGWFREQFCTMICPYGRFQSVLMDRQSLVVAYDAGRGEPRSGAAAIAGSKAGDCVNCYRCVQVCPTGIDIRRGTQLECVACTACIDACDDVMTRLKKPLGLIRYGSLSLAENQQEDSAAWFRRPRAWIYLALLAGCASALIVTVRGRVPIEMTLIRATESPYQVIPAPGGTTQILNHFKIDVLNQTFDSQGIGFELAPDLIREGAKFTLSNLKTTLAAGERARGDLFVQFPRSLAPDGRGTLSFTMTSHSGDRELRLEREVRLVGPLR